MPVDREAFSGGVAVITGAGSGIGASLARRAGALGMTVVVTDLHASRAEAVADEIRQAGGAAEALAVDVSKPSALDGLAAWVADAFGPVRLLVNNAGIETLGCTWEIPAERWEATLCTNIHGVVHGARAFVPRMIEAGQQAYVANVASIVSFSAMPTQTAYVMTKHAVQAFSEGLFMEMQLVGAPIHVASVLPGLIKTHILDPDAGEGEPDSAARYRRTMFDLLDRFGMDCDEAAEKFLLQIAERRFWVLSHPADTMAAIERRARFLRGLENPELSAQGRQLLESSI